MVATDRVALYQHGAVQFAHLASVRRVEVGHPAEQRQTAAPHLAVRLLATTTQQNTYNRIEYVHASSIHPLYNGSSASELPLTRAVELTHYQRLKLRPYDFDTDYDRDIDINFDSDSDQFLRMPRARAFKNC